MPEHSTTGKLHQEIIRVYEEGFDYWDVRADRWDSV
jgi:hypothetical protein